MTDQTPSPAPEQSPCACWPGRLCNRSAECSAEAMVRATNTPWRTQTTNYEQNMGRNEPVVIVDSQGNHIATCGWPGAPTAEDVENARAIVQAVNAAAAWPIKKVPDLPDPRVGMLAGDALGGGF